MNTPVTVRLAEKKDAGKLLEIYAPYVTDTAVTFEYEVPSAGEFAGRMEQTLMRYPYLAACRGEEILGYAYASAFHSRAAYSWAAETSVYVREDCRGQGIGRLLYQRMEKILDRQGVLNLNACIAFPNPGSVAFHEKQGYRIVGHFTQCGYKLGQWWDMVWMEKLLHEHPVPPALFTPFPALTDKSC